MTYEPLKHHRRSLRLKGYDYSKEGAYFVTICTFERECVLGEIKDRVMSLSGCGEIIRSCWDKIPDHFENVESGEYVVMPNHVHGVIFLRDVPGRDEVACGAKTIRRDEVTSSLHRTSSLQSTSSLHGTSSLQTISSLRDVTGTESQHETLSHETIQSLQTTSSLQKMSTLPTTSPHDEISAAIKRSPALGQVVAFYKYQTTKLINANRGAPGARFWQRNYHEHIIRGTKDLKRIQKYMADNVGKWSEDEENPNRDPRKMNGVST